MLWQKAKLEFEADLAAKPRNPIKVTLPDGKQVEATSWETSAYDVAKGISQGLADNTVIAKVNGVLWDLDRVLEEDCTLQLLKFDDPEAQAVFWHSSAHMMGEAMEKCYGGHLCYGPPIEGGFYYDMFLEGDGVSSYFRGNRFFNYQYPFIHPTFLLGNVNNIPYFLQSPFLENQYCVSEIILQFAVLTTGEVRR